MKTYITTIHAVCPKDGVVKAYSGPNVPGNSFEDAQQYCENNGLGYCKVTGETADEITSDHEIAVRDALLVISKIASDLLMRSVSPFVEDWDLPKTTSKKTIRKIIEVADKHNNTARQRAIKLSNAHKILSKHFLKKKISC